MTGSTKVIKLVPGRGCTGCLFEDTDCFEVILTKGFECRPGTVFKIVEDPTGGLGMQHGAVFKIVENKDGD